MKLQPFEKTILADWSSPFQKLLYESKQGDDYQSFNGEIDL